MDVIEGLLVGCNNFAYVFKSSSIAVLLFISDWYQGIGQVEIVFHEKTNVNGCDGEKEVFFVVLHFLDELAISFDESENEMQR